MDFRLNDLNGIKFAKEIRKIRGCNIFIILMTGCLMSHSLRQSEMVNVINKVIVKPFSLKNLEFVLNYYINRYYSNQPRAN